MNPVFSFPFFEERARWALWLPVFMLLGIGLYFSLKTEPSWPWLFLTPGLILPLLASRNIPALRPVLAVFLAFALGFNAAQVQTLRVAAPQINEPTEPVSIIGTLIRAEAMPDGARLTLKDPWIKDMEKEQRPDLLRMKVRTPYEALPEAGTRVNVWGPLWPPSEPVTPGGYDFRRHAFFMGLGGSGMSYVEPRVRESKYETQFFWDGFFLLFEGARRALTVQVYARVNGPEKAVTATLLSGSQSGIDPDVLQAMRASGIVHLLSISGVHVSMMAMLVYVPLRFGFALIPFVALRLPIKKIAAVTALIATTLYTLLVGADAPTVRSALMIGIVLFAILADRKAMSLRLVALAAAALMLWSPSAAMGASFQMSFAAVLAMIAAYEKRADAALLSLGQTQSTPEPTRFHPWLSWPLRHGKDIALTSLIATAATTPFTIYHFQVFSFYGVIANMIAIPLTSFWILPCILLAYLFAPFGLAGWFIDGAGWGVAQLITLAKTVAAWPYAHIPFPPMPDGVLIAMIAGWLWLCLWQRRWRYLGLVPIFLGCFYPLFVSAPSVYISAEEPVWAVTLQDGRMAVFGKRKETFAIAQWRQRSGQPEALFFSAKHPPDFPGELTCDPVQCVFEKEGKRIAFLIPPKKEKRKQEDDQDDSQSARDRIDGTNPAPNPSPRGGGLVSSCGAALSEKCTREEKLSPASRWNPPPLGEGLGAGAVPQTQNAANKAYPPCPTADVIVAFEPMDHCQGHGAVIVDETALASRGAAAITFEKQGLTVRHVRDNTQHRPWSVEPKFP